MVPWERTSGLHSGVHTHTCTYTHMHLLSHTHILISLAYAYLHVHTHTHICSLTCTHMYLFHTHTYTSLLLFLIHTPHPRASNHFHIYTQNRNTQWKWEQHNPTELLSFGISGKEMTSSEILRVLCSVLAVLWGPQMFMPRRVLGFSLRQIWSIYRLFAKPGQLLSRHVPLPTKSSLPANARFPRLQSSMPVLPTVTAPSHRCWRSLGNLARATEEVNFKSGLV